MLYAVRMDLPTYLAEEHGRAARLARRIGKSPAFVSQLALKQRPVPVPLATAIELATEAKVTRRELRPDDWSEIWPELVGTPGVPAVGVLPGKQAQAL